MKPTSRSFFSFSQVMVAALVFFCAIAISPAQNATGPAANTKSQQLYFYVVDRSDSMWSTLDEKIIAQNGTTYETYRDVVIGTFADRISRLPETDEADVEVRVALFATGRTVAPATRIYTNANTQANRDKIVEDLKRDFKSEGDATRYTRLYATIGECLREIRADKGKYNFVSFQVFTDGDDNASRSDPTPNVARSWAEVDKIAEDLEMNVQETKGVFNARIWAIGNIQEFKDGKSKKMETEFVKPKDLGKLGKKVQESEPLRARFSYSPYAPKVGDIIDLKDDSDGTPDLRQWTVNGKKIGEGRDLKELKYQADSDGEITIRLTLYQGNKRPDYVEHVLTVSRDKLTTPLIEISPASVRYGDTVTLSTPAPRAGEIYEWKVSGTTKSQSPDAEFKWKADKLGEVTIELTAKNDTSVSEPSIKTITVATNPPDATFTLTPNPAVTPVKEGATLTAIANDKSPEVTHTWEWAGTSTTGQTVQITFPKSGDYTLAHTATWAGGSNKTEQRIIVASNPPPAEFTVKAGGKTIQPGAEVDMDEQIIVEAAKTVDDAKHEWMLSSGTTLANATAKFRAHDAGPLTITHNVTSVSKGPSARKETINVREKVDVAFSVSAKKGGAPLKVTFKDKTVSNAKLATSQWNFDDGTPLAVGNEVTHEYTGTGTYTPVLTVRTVAGREVRNKEPVTITVTKPCPWWCWLIIPGIIVLLALIAFVIWRKKQGNPVKLSGILDWTREGKSGFYQLNGEEEYNLLSLLIPGWYPEEKDYIIEGTRGGGTHVFEKDKESGNVTDIKATLQKAPAETEFKIDDVSFKHSGLEKN